VHKKNRKKILSCKENFEYLKAIGKEVRKNICEMDRKISSSRKLSMDMHRKLSAISTCSDVSNLSYKLGMEPDDFKCTIKNILDLDVGEAWTLDSDDELSCYGDDITSNVTIDDGANSASNNDLVTLQVDRKSSTGSQISTDSLDSAEEFVPVQIDVNSVKSVLNLYQKHRKISMSKIQPKTNKE